MIGVGKAVPYQQARAFLVNTGQTYTVTVVVAYKKWGWGPIISLKENAQVYVGNNDYSVWIKR